MAQPTTGTRRPVRVANCSGAKVDPGIHMLNQARHGNVDVITGDYLAGAYSRAFLQQNRVDL